MTEIQGDVDGDLARNIRARRDHVEELHRQPPVRLCCSQRHWGPVCPDEKVMCCICYGRFTADELHVDATGVTWDVCADCGKQVGE